MAAIIFSLTKWLPKITDYRDTAAFYNYKFMFLCGLVFVFHH